MASATPSGAIDGRPARITGNRLDAPVRACVTCHHVQAGTCSLPLNDLDCGADRPKWRAAAWLVVARAIAPRLV